MMIMPDQFPFARHRGSSFQDWLYKLYRVLYFLWLMKILSKTKITNTVATRVSPRTGSLEGRCLRNRCSRSWTLLGVYYVQFCFWGTFTRLPTTTTATSPDSLQQLRCYDNDMADPSSSSTATAGYLSLSSLFIFLFLFLPFLQYACLDVPQSSFKYACLECVTFKLSICVYVIFMSNIFWIKIVRKLSIFLTHKSGVFSTRSMYMAIIKNGIIPRKCPIWKLKIPLKIKIFLWYIKSGVGKEI
jgi:hypothetical protein